MTDIAVTAPRKLRSREWFDNPDNIDMTALYLERQMNFGLTLQLWCNSFYRGSLMVLCLSTLKQPATVLN